MQSVLARSALRARAPAAFRSVGIQRRALHVNNVAGNATPFKHERKDSVMFGAKVTVFLLTGAMIPVVASYYQLRKSG